MKIIKALVIVLPLIYLVILLLVYLAQDKLLFFPEKLPKDFKYNLSADDKEVFIKTADNILINGILYKRPGNQQVILYFHGNAGSLSGWQDVSSEILALHSDLLIIDNRGYGKSEGSFSEKGFYEDGRAALKYLLDLGYKNDQVVLYGRSLGTGIAAELASTEKVKGLILESPYTSMKSLAMEKTPYFLPSLLLKYSLNTLSKAPKFEAPTLIMHGRNDELIPYAHGQKIFDAIQVKKTLVLIDGGGHNNLSQFPQHKQALEQFLNQTTELYNSAI